jgi:hypothetical protein
MADAVESFENARELRRIQEVARYGGFVARLCITD